MILPCLLAALPAAAQNDTGIEDTTVYLNDLESHTWVYYSDANCPIRSLSPADVTITYRGNGIVMTGNSDYTAGITTGFVRKNNSNYNGSAAVGVTTAENQTTFVYYKTLERAADQQTAVDWTASTKTGAKYRCAYTAIPNPFQKRPTYGSTGNSRWRGFQCWRVVSVTNGTIYTTSTDNTTIAAGGIINANQEVYFAPTTETGMAVVLEAVWAIADLKEASSNNNANEITNSSRGVERNFLVLTQNASYRFGGGNGARITGTGRAATISRYYPDGSIGNANATVRGYGDESSITLNTDTKFENVIFTELDGTYESGTGRNRVTNPRYISANGKNLTIGRGCSGTVNAIYGYTTNPSSNTSYTQRIESGTFTNFYAATTINTRLAYTLSTKTVFGSDYDRAQNDNNKLSIGNGGSIYGGKTMSISQANNRNNLTFDWDIKSGTFNGPNKVGYGQGGTESIYIGSSQSGYAEDRHNGTDYYGLRYIGKRRIIVEGGLLASIAGGMNHAYNNNSSYAPNEGYAVEIRIKGGEITGAVYGAASFAGATGNRRFVITGGQVNGWIAGGCNGTESSGGDLAGDTYMYVGGNVQIGNNSGGTHVGGTISGQGTNGADGGHIFGAGCGILPNNGNFTSNTVGNVDNSTIVIADEATVWRDVHGGGNYGWVRAGGKSTLYVNGGTVKGNIFGGSNNQQGQEVAITIVGDGTVEGGVYGGSHSWGAINNNVSINISGGTQKGGVYGGGYGTDDNACGVSGKVDITMTDGKVYTGLYGGSNVNGTISGNVTMQIDGGQVGEGSGNTASQLANIHGGGLGADTKVNGNVSVTLGHCGASSGVVVYGDVYGGSAKGKVNTNSSNNTNVTLMAGTVYGAIYGGGYGPGGENADVNGKVSVAVLGGSVLTRSDDPQGEAGTGSVFGCNNISGAPKSTVSVDIYNTDQPASGYALHAVYGGGNKSAYSDVPVVTIHGCKNSIEYVFGGGNATSVKGTNVTVWGGTIGYVFGGGNGAGENNPGANITASGTTVNIYGGKIGEVFGGSNEKGTINSTITVNVKAMQESGSDPCTNEAYTLCAMDITKLYGGGNKAEIKDNNGEWLDQPSVNLDCTAKIGTLFGGAKRAKYGKSLELVVNGGTFTNVFGGNDVDGVIEGDVTVTVTAGQVGNVFGGNNEGGDVKGKITVNINQATTNPCSDPFKVGNVYGGGNQAPYTPTTVGSYPEVNIINGTVNECVYGGGLGEKAVVTSNPHVTMGGTNGEKQTGTAVVMQNIYGGGNAAVVKGNTLIEMVDGTVGDNDDTNEEHGCVFGAGRGTTDKLEAAQVQGDTHVILSGGTVNGNVYGGGHLGQVTGNTKVEIK